MLTHLDCQPSNQGEVIVFVSAFVSVRDVQMQFSSLNFVCEYGTHISTLCCGVI